MIGKFSGQDVPASGFSIGFERIVTILKDHMQGVYKLAGEPTAFLIGNKVSLERKAEVLAQAAKMRESGAIVTVMPMAKNIKHQIELLEAEGYTRFEKIYE
jgi:histidyl-tRNA synthetase